MTARHMTTVEARDFIASMNHLLSYEPAWMQRAACKLPENKGVDFFPIRGGVSGPAFKICSGCPVRETCAKEGEYEAGIWGGTSEEQRKQRRGQRDRRLC